ncbi:hypothetical protein NIE88_06480 [Sporolactobacillus shoreicorticis]|nr:hypothetical protein [Sporolactobacillus shoreicorticis]
MLLGAAVQTVMFAALALGAVLFFKYQSALLWTCALIIFIYLLAMFFMIHETKPPKKSEKRNVKLIELVFRSLWGSMKLIASDKVFGLYILAVVFAIFTIMQLDLYLAVYVINYVPAQPLISWDDWRFMLSSSEVFGWLLGLNGLMFVLLILPISRRLKNWSERHHAAFMSSFRRWNVRCGVEFKPLVSVVCDSGCVHTR